MKYVQALALLTCVFLIVLYVRYQTAPAPAKSSEPAAEELFDSATVEKHFQAVNSSEGIHFNRATHGVQPDGYHYFDNIQDTDQALLQKQKNIFFILSTRFSDGDASLTSRQACAIESAARANPASSVIVLFVNTARFKFPNSHNIVALLPYPNIYLRSLNLTTYGIGSPVENLLRSDSLKKSSFIVEHTSDVLRLLTLFRYGGTYLDTDVVVMRSLDELPHNYLITEGGEYVANGIINLQATGCAHEYAKACLIELANHFNGTQFASNGPQLVTRVLRRFCRISKKWDMSHGQCRDKLRVLPPETAFQVLYPNQTWFFEERFEAEVLHRLAGGVLTHLWNALTKKITLRKDSRAAYIWLAQNFCPNVYNTCGEYF